MDFFGMYPYVKFKRLNPNAPMPKFAREGDAGFDLCTMETVTIQPFQIVMVHTGLATAIPAFFEGTIRPRSGMAAKRGVTLANAPATIDSNYRGEILLPLYNMTTEPVTVEAGERVAQMLIKLQPQPTLMLVDELDETERGDQGFGSSGYGRL